MSAPLGLHPAPGPARSSRATVTGLADAAQARSYPRQERSGRGPCGELVGRIERHTGSSSTACKAVRATSPRACRTETRARRAQLPLPGRCSFNPPSRNQIELRAAALTGSRSQPGDGRQSCCGTRFVLWNAPTQAMGEAGKSWWRAAAIPVARWGGSNNQPDRRLCLAAEPRRPEDGSFGP